MKLLFGTDITNDKNNTELAGSEFIVERTDRATLDSLERANEKVEHEIEKTKLPTALRLIKSIAGYAFAAMAILFVRFYFNNSTEGVGFSQIYARIPWALWIAVGGGIVWVVLAIIAHKHSEEIVQTGDLAFADKNSDLIVESIYRNFSVPEGTPDTDILCISYKQKNGEIKPKSRKTLPAHINIAFKVFNDGTRLCIAERANKYAIDLSCIKGIRRVDKRIYMAPWNKDEYFNEGIYKQYKMTANQYGHVYMKYYYALEFVSNGVEWELHFPCYEFETFKKALRFQ